VTQAKIILLLTLTLCGGAKIAHAGWKFCFQVPPTGTHDSNDMCTQLNELLNAQGIPPVFCAGAWYSKRNLMGPTGNTWVHGCWPTSGSFQTAHACLCALDEMQAGYGAINDIGTGCFPDGLPWDASDPTNAYATKQYPNGLPDCDLSSFATPTPTPAP